MIDYATYQRIQHLHRVELLTVAQIAHTMALDARTVRRWLDEPRFRPRVPCARPSKLDPFKGYIRRLLEHHPYSAAQILSPALARSSGERASQRAAHRGLAGIELASHGPCARRARAGAVRALGEPS